MNKIYQKSFLGVKNAGFALLELLVVVLIISILAAVAVPQYERSVTKARFTQVLTAGKSLKEACESYYLANGVYPTHWSQLDIEYPGCVASPTHHYYLWCKNFAVDLFSGTNENLVFYDTSLIENPVNMDATALSKKTKFKYTVWLDHSKNPGKTECIGVQGLCKSMGF